MINLNRFIYVNIQVGYTDDNDHIHCETYIVYIYIEIRKIFHGVKVVLSVLL